MGHDQLFKAILEKFFKDFLELFFPSVAKRLNFGSLVFLDKELFADLPQGPTREVDVVAKLETTLSSRSTIALRIARSSMSGIGMPPG